MRAPGNKIGIYAHMQFQLSENGDRLLGSTVLITRASPRTFLVNLPTKIQARCDHLYKRRSENRHVPILNHL